MSETTRSRLALALCLAAVAVAAAVRWPPVFGDFWLDEIWTWSSMRMLDSPLQVFTRIHQSNNHHLNTLIYYALGEHVDWWWYRVPAFAAGVASVGLAAAIAWRKGRPEAVFAAWLAAGSFALVHFSSEARGYAYAVFFALICLWALERDRPGCRALFAVSALLGFLSHLAFGFFYAGAVVWSWRQLGQRPGAVRALAALHVLPLVGLAALYAVDLHTMTVGGGPPAVADQVLARTFGFGLGLRVSRDLGFAYACLGASLLALGIRQLRRQRDDSWILYAIAIGIAPVAVMLSLRPEVVAVRYFLISLALLLLLSAFLLGDLYRRGGARRIASLVLLAGFLAGNAVHIRGFLEYGRGGYREALLRMARETDSPAIVVSSDHDFRNGTVLRFYARELPANRRLDYRTAEQRPPGGPEWVIRHALENPARVPESIRDDRGHLYTLVAEFPHAAISGFHWALYRNAASVEP